MAGASSDRWPVVGDAGLRLRPQAQPSLSWIGDLTPPFSVRCRPHRELTVRGFRSLAKVEDLQLPQLAVLIGANGSGKSNLIRFFQMLGWMPRGQNLQEFVLRQGGGDDQLFMGVRTTPRLDAEICIETQAGRNDYRFALTHVAGDTLMLVDEAYRFSARER